VAEEIRTRGTAQRRLRIAFVCFGRPTFDLAAAETIAEDSLRALRQLDAEWVVAGRLITHIGAVEETASRLHGQADLLMAQFTTFVDARFIDEIATRLRVPVLLWSIPERNRGTGQRLSLNSLTGANIAGQRLFQRGIPFQFVYGDASESAFIERVASALRFWTAWWKLHRFTVVTLGDAPEGFFFSRPGDQVRKQLGIQEHHLNLSDTFARAVAVSDAEASSELETVQQKVRGIQALPKETVTKFAKMMTVLLRDLAEIEADAVAVRCWPEFFTDFGAAACSMLSALTDSGLMGACEADVLGSLSMSVLHALTGSAAYLGDLVEIDETGDAVTFWHCGAGAFSLAHPGTGAVAGKHPNRNMGFTLEFGLKPGRVTILRVGEDADGTVRALVGTGDALDVPQRFKGTSVTVRLLGDGELTERVTRVIESGFEPHYALGYGDVGDALERLFKLTNIPVARF
jgi:L-fucose isomerase-like protein